MRNRVPAHAEALEAIGDGIERELRRVALWNEEAPNTTALTSSEPFCFDTLVFHEWLQWVFLPGLRAIAAGKLEFPVQSRILPYAEEGFGQHLDDDEQLLFLIRSFDELVEIVNAA